MALYDVGGGGGAGADGGLGFGGGGVGVAEADADSLRGGMLDQIELGGRRDCAHDHLRFASVIMGHPGFEGYGQELDLAAGGLLEAVEELGRGALEQVWWGGRRAWHATGTGLRGGCR